jgi:hypothetical protein
LIENSSREDAYIELTNHWEGRVFAASEYVKYDAPIVRAGEDKYAGIILYFPDPTTGRGPFLYSTLEEANVTKKDIAKYFPMSERTRTRMMGITEPPEEFFWFAKVEKSKHDN